MPPRRSDKDDDDVDEDDDDELPTLEASLDTECEKTLNDTTTDNRGEISFGTVSGNTATKPKNRRYKMKD
jgi:hypothetical protein